MSPLGKPLSMEVCDPKPLLLAAHAGDRDAVDRLLRPYRPVVHQYLRKRARTPQDAEDLLSNTLLRVLRYLPSFRGECPVGALLLRAAACEVMNYYEREVPRHERTVPVNFDEDDWMFPETDRPLGRPDTEAVRSATMARLMESLRTACSPVERVVLELVYQGESFEDIARTLEVKSALVRTHFLRGRGKLMAYLFEHDPEFLGGEEIISWACRKAMDSDNDHHRLQPEEIKAMASPNGRVTAFRSACLKVARFLPLPAGLGALLGLLARGRGWF